jgi:predicted MFS family arabinose efflux permease
MNYYHLSQTAVAVFSLVGAMGATSAPISGRLADAGHTHRATAFALALAAIGYLPVMLVPRLGVFGLVGTGLLLGFAVQMNLVLGQREIYQLDPDSHNRLNSIYITSVFVGGVVGSAIASTLYRHSGWSWVAVVGMLFPLLALSGFLFAGKPAK